MDKTFKTKKRNFEVNHLLEVDYIFLSFISLVLYVLLFTLDTRYLLFSSNNLI